MNTETNERAMLALRLIAAKAAKLADDLSRGRLYPGDLTKARSELAAALADVKE